MLFKKKILQNNAKTSKLLDKLPTIYIVTCWAKYIIVEFKFAGCNKHGIPMIYKYEDMNGTADEYHLVEVYYATSAGVYSWLFSREAAEHQVQIMNEWLEKQLKKPIKQYKRQEKNEESK